MSEEKKKDALVRTETGGVFRSVERLAEAIKMLGEKHNLVSPGGAIGGELPMLHAPAISFVFANPQSDGYPIPGSSKRGVSKAKLEEIAAALGIRWLTAECGQVDKWNDPHRVKYQSAATVKQLDGTERLIVASKVIDLRAWEDKPEDQWGSDAQEIARTSKAHKDRDGKPDPKSPWPEIMRARQNIHANGETKSRLRCIRSVGIKTAYEPDEMRKGWAVIHLQFTGRHEDPRIERMVAEKIADRALAAGGMLYGSRPALPAAQGEQRQIRELPETVDPGQDDEPGSYDPDTGEVHEPAKAPAPPPDAEVLGAKQADGKWTMVKASSLNLDALIEKIERTERNLHDGKVKRPDEAQRQLTVLHAWKAYREEEAIRNHVDDGSTPF